MAECITVDSTSTSHERQKYASLVVLRRRGVAITALPTGTSTSAGVVLQWSELLVLYGEPSNDL